MDNSDLFNAIDGCLLYAKTDDIQKAYNELAFKVHDYVLEHQDADSDGLFNTDTDTGITIRAIELEYGSAIRYYCAMTSLGEAKIIDLTPFVEVFIDQYVISNNDLGKVEYVIEPCVSKPYLMSAMYSFIVKIKIHGQESVPIVVDKDQLFTMKL